MVFRRPIYPSLHLFPLSPPQLFFLDRAAGCIVSSQCLASPHVQTFFGNYKQPSQPREARVDSFPVCINIYQAWKHRQMSTMRRFLRVARWRAHSCSGLKCNPSIRFVVFKHFVQLHGGGGVPASLADAELENFSIDKMNVPFQWDGNCDPDAYWICSVKWPKV